MSTCGGYLKGHGLENPGIENPGWNHKQARPTACVCTIDGPILEPLPPTMPSSVAGW
jgi:hypothetical protein